MNDLFLNLTNREVAELIAKFKDREQIKRFVDGELGLSFAHTPTLAAWMRIKLSEKSSASKLLEALDSAEIEVENIKAKARFLLGKVGLQYSLPDRDLVCLTLHDLGFRRSVGESVTYSEVLSRVATLNLRLCPKKVGPLLSLELSKQVVAVRPGTMYIVSETVEGRNGYKNIFAISVQTYGIDLFTECPAEGSGWDDLETQFVFTLPIDI